MKVRNNVILMQCTHIILSSLFVIYFFSVDAIQESFPVIYFTKFYEFFCLTFGKCSFSRLNPMGLLVALSDEGSASGDLFWDDGESIGRVKSVLKDFRHSEDHLFRVTMSETGYYSHKSVSKLLSLNVL